MTLSILKTFALLKALKRMKRQTIERAKVLSNHISDKGFVSRIHKSQNTTVKLKLKGK